MSPVPYYVDGNEIPLTMQNGNGSKVLLTEANGCVHDCMTGITHNCLCDYPAPQAHPFQEGFYVVSGTGIAKVGDQEFPLRPGVSFLAPAGVYHAVKTDDPAVPVIVFWFHAQ